MNHTYRLIWNEATQTYVPVAEGTRTRKKSGGCKAIKRLCVAIVASLGTAYASSALAGPSGGEVIAGEASIVQNGATTTVNQQSQNASLNWQQFNIAANETVQFVQPSASSVALNRVVGSEASAIYGQLRANGQVFLINPNGVLFGRTAQVDVGGLVASTLNLSDEDFLAGNFRFTGDTPAGIVNQGTITAAEGGSVALLGGQVSNQGTISARLGTVALAAGSAVSLDFSGQQLMNVKVDAATFDALVQNHHLIQADGGTVIMTAAARDALLSTVVNNTGVIQARTVEERDGEILLLGGFDGGTVQVGGTLDASAPNGGDGGFIETSGAYVKVADDARITTSAPQGSSGTWLIDPPDFTIAASGGDISGATLGANLENGNVSILSSQGTANLLGNGDIHVNDAITWSSGTTLTLTALRDVNVNQAITNTGSPANGGVTLRADSTGACVAGAVTCGTVNFADAGRITAATTNLYYNPVGSNAAANANGIGPSYATAAGYATFIFGTSNVFMLVNDINQLQAVNTNLAGSYALGRNIDASATSGWNGGAGFDPLGDLSENSFSGHFDGRGHTISGLFINRPTTDGVGLFASTNVTTIRNVDLIGGSMTGLGFVGALVGVHDGGVSNVSSSVRVSGSMDYVGGLFGYQTGVVTDVHSTGQVTGSGFVGGLMGRNFGTISNASATGVVNGEWDSIGGLVGQNDGSITNAYAIGQVSGGSFVGGLVGQNVGTVNTSYATGAVIGTQAATAGGLVGANTGAGTVTNSFYDVLTTGQGATSNGRGTGLTTTGFMSQGSFVSGWDFTNTWFISTGNTRPFLRSEYSTTITNAHQLQLMQMNLSANYVLGADIDLAEVTQASGLWNTSRGFVPVGLGTSFTGSFDGAGHSITGLFIDRSSNDTIGLFGTNAGTIQNVGLIGGSVRGRDYVGGLVGLNNNIVRNAYASVSVTGGGSVGGLLGSNNSGASVSNAYTTGAVIGTSRVGGLIGSNSGTVTNVYATGAVSGQTEVGGLLGFHNGGSGSVLSYGYATGLVTGTSDVGGLVGRRFGSIVNSFWDTQTSGRADQFDGRGVGKTSEQMRDADTFSAWDIAASGGSNAVWRIYDGYTGPLLRNFMTAATVDVFNASTTYNGNARTFDVIYDAGSVDRSLIFTGNSSFRNAGTYSLGDALYSNQQGYDISFTGGTLNIARANVSLSSRNVVKTYDGTTGASGTATTVPGSFLLGSDSLSGGTFAFTDKNAGSGKTVTTSGVTINDGNGGNNYNVTYIDNTTSTINRRDLTLAAVSGTKTYDGTTSSNNLVNVSGLAAGDIAGTTTAYDSKNVLGTNGSTLRVTNYSLVDGTGADMSANYNVSTSTAAGTINAKTLTYTATATDKIYDGTTAATVTLSGLTGLVGTETLSVSGTGTFNSKDVATANTVTVNSVALLDGSNGGLASNYSIATGGTAAANIKVKSLTYTAAATDKVYDGTTAAAVTLSGLSGLVGNETLGVSGTGAFNSKDVATANTVTVNTATLANGNNGGLASNYSIAAGSTAAASITAKSLTYATSAIDKVYDGTTAATVTLSGLTGLVGTETLGVSGTGTFNSKDVATANTVTVNTANLTDGSNGGLASNYSITAGGTAAANITARSLTYTTATTNKVYDGTTATTVTLSGLSGLVGNETLGASGTGTFNSKDVATANTVTIDTATLVNGSNGGLASNYSIAAGGTAAANITAKSLTYTTTATDKVYDGTTAATVTLGGLTGLVGDETLGVSGTGTFNSKDVATANTVTVNTANVTDGNNGGLASNYSIATGGTAAANITAKSLTYTTTATNKVYDGTTAATVALSGLTGLVGNETLGVSGTGTFNSKDVATANTVTVNTANLTNGSNGGLASNYSIAAGGTTAARITPAALTIAANNQARPINTPNPSFTATYTGFAAGESVATLTTQPTLSTNADATSAAGSYAIDVSGAVAPNYAVTYVPGTLIVTGMMPLPDYLGALSYADDIGSADRNEQEELQNETRFSRNVLLPIKNRGIRLPTGVPPLP